MGGQHLLLGTVQAMAAGKKTNMPESQTAVRSKNSAMCWQGWPCVN